MVAYFTFEQASPDGVIKTFVFELTDAARIAEARALIADPRATKVRVMGTIVPSRASYNPDWLFHLDPSTIDFFELHSEVCDANVTYVEKHLDEIGGTTLPGRFWCPWSSKLTAELTPKPQ